MCSTILEKLHQVKDNNLSRLKNDDNFWTESAQTPNLIYAVKSLISGLSMAWSEEEIK